MSIPHNERIQSTSASSSAGRHGAVQPTLRANVHAKPYPSMTLLTKSHTSPRSNWTYRDAFSRNLGLISSEEQERLRSSRAAVVGLGGVGGIDLVALARL